MSKIIYPDDTTLKLWINILRNPSNTSPIKRLSDYLPLVNEQWYERVMGTVSLVEMISYFPKSLHGRASHIFFKIVENHSHIDSNKRSAIITVYLFFIINGYMFSGDPEKVRQLAKGIAAREYIGNQELIEGDIKMLEREFKKMFTPEF